MDIHNSINPPGTANLIILEDDKVHVQVLDIQTEWTIGRYHPNMPNAPDIHLSSMIVSKEHGWIQNIDDQWYYIDNPQNLNGTFHNGIKIPRPMPGMRRPTPLENGDLLRIDNKDLNHVSSKGVVMLFTTVETKGTWTIYHLSKDATVIGSGKSCDITEPLPNVSPKHAKITYINGTYYLSDCNSQAGTFLNGKQIKTSTVLRKKDCISLCDCYYIFLGDKLLYEKRTGEWKQAILRVAKLLKKD